MKKVLYLVSVEEITLKHPQEIILDELREM